MERTRSRVIPERMVLVEVPPEEEEIVLVEETEDENYYYPEEEEYTYEEVVEEPEPQPRPQKKQRKSNTKPKSNKPSKPVKHRQPKKRDIKWEDLDDTELAADAGPSAERLKQEAKERHKLERFITIRMWISLLISKFFNDRGVIPRNIGNNVLITNNQYLTKNHISQMIQVREMSEYTPMMWMSDLLEEVKDQATGILIDFTVKMMPYEIDVNASGMASRLRTWKMTLDNPLMPKDSVRRAARCLYSYDVIKNGEKAYKGYTYITVRSVNNLQLKKGVNAICAYLDSIGAIYKRIDSNIEEHLLFAAAMSDKRPEHLKDLPPVIYTNETIAESLPGIQGMNNIRGIFMGYDIISGYPYLIDFKGSSNAKNILIEANSGFGKTFMASFWLYPFYADGFNLCIMDLKGTEFGAITQALHGVTISMRNDAPYYINTFVWDTRELLGRDPKSYANHQIRLCKEKMLIMASLNAEEQSQGESLIEEFLQMLYILIGAKVDNMGTWSRTANLTPYIVFEYFEKFISHEIQTKYPKIAKKVLERLRIFMSAKGSNSHIFRKALSYIEILDNRVLRFDFGVMEESSDQDPAIFRLRVLDMTIVNDAFVMYKKENKEWTVKLLEESQIADSYLLEVYKREITLRRAANQVTVLLGNSISALYNNPQTRPMLENINILVLGAINKSSRDFLKNDFGLQDDQNIMLSDIQVNGELDHTFLLVNRMEKNATTALLQADVPNEVRNSSLFRVVDEELQ